MSYTDHSVQCRFIFGALALIKKKNNKVERAYWLDLTALLSDHVTE